MAPRMIRKANPTPCHMPTPMMTAKAVVGSASQACSSPRPRLPSPTLTTPANGCTDSAQKTATALGGATAGRTTARGRPASRPTHETRKRGENRAQCRDTQGYSYAHDDRLDQGGPDGVFGEDLDEVFDARPLTRSDARPVRQRRAHQVEDREAEEDREDRQPGQQHGHRLPGRPCRSSPPARCSCEQQSRLTHAARGLFAAGNHNVVRSLFDGDLGAAELEPGGTTGS